MFLRFLRPGLLLMLAGMASAEPPPLKVCADPQNLPFSNRRGEGFENRLAELVARSLQRKLEYHWARHTGRGFVRNVLNQGECDLLISVPAGLKPVLTTAPYYRSAYFFVSRGRRHIHSFDDDSLRRLKIGVQVVEEEYAPPAIALGRRGMLANLVAYEAIGKDSGNIVRAVAKREVDVAVVWGPLAGYYVKRLRRLHLSQAPAFDSPALPLTFAISMAVRKDDVALREQVDRVLNENRRQIAAILRRFGVPQLPLEGAKSGL
jgi:mxaJ protein